MTQLEIPLGALNPFICTTSTDAVPTSLVVWSTGDIAPVGSFKLHIQAFEGGRAMSDAVVFAEIDEDTDTLFFRRYSEHLFAFAVQELGEPKTTTAKIFLFDKFATVYKIIETQITGDLVHCYRGESHSENDLHVYIQRDKKLVTSVGCDWEQLNVVESTDATVATVPIVIQPDIHSEPLIAWLNDDDKLEYSITDSIYTVINFEARYISGQVSKEGIPAILGYDYSRREILVAVAGLKDCAVLKIDHDGEGQEFLLWKITGDSEITILARDYKTGDLWEITGYSKLNDKLPAELQSHLYARDTYAYVVDGNCANSPVVIAYNSK